MVNGGIKSINEAKQHLYHLDGVMIGPEDYQNLALLTQVDLEFFDKGNQVTDPTVSVQVMYPYIERELKYGTYLDQITSHMLGIFQAIPGASQWRPHFTESANKKGANITVVKEALEFITGK
ncbi:MAG: tRNA-dihydrouridine synthase [Arsenophonus sp.]